MKKILLNEVIPSESCKKVTHYEVVEHNGKKFLIYVEGSNGDCIGFNHKCCLSIMTSEGTWEHVVDNYSLGFTDNQSSIYYSHSVAEKERLIDDSVNHFKDYIKAVY